MTSETIRTQVFISGGGIAGLTLGLILAREGVAVTIAERWPGSGKMYKGELIQPKSLEILDRLDLLEPLLASSFKVQTMRFRELHEENGPEQAPAYPENGPEQASAYTDHRRAPTSAYPDVVFNYGILQEPYNYALMHPHEQLKERLLEAARQFPSFRWIQPGTFRELVRDRGGRASAARVDTPEGELFVHADLFVGAEGRASPMRQELQARLSRMEYNHHFLTVSFGRPAALDEALILSRGARFLGLFPLPDNQVRTVLLIRPEEYRQLRRSDIAHFHNAYLSLMPELDGYVQEVEHWSLVQLMIPFRHHVRPYVRDNVVLLGDAAHNVHPMAGEGMNMAIQDADILGRLIGWAYRNGKGESPAAQLSYFEQIRYPRARRMSRLSHLSALAYSYDTPLAHRLRRRILKQIEQSDYLQFKYMLNISGLGSWPETLLDRLRQLGLLGSPDAPTKEERLARRYRAGEDYPWS